MSSQAQIKAQKRYEEKCMQWHMRLNLVKDSDIVAWLKVQKSASASVKDLIRKSIAERSSKV